MFSATLFAFALLGSASASRLCGTTVSAERRVELEADFESKRVICHPTKEVKIPVYWHVIQKNNTLEGGHVPFIQAGCISSEQQIHDQITVLNTAFTGSGLAFKLKKFHYVTNEEWFAKASPYDDGLPTQDEMKAALRKGDEATLNLYSVGFEEGDAAGGLLGYANLPADYEANPTDDGVVFLYSSTPGGTTTRFNLGGTVQHEVGHWVGLYHTFNDEPGPFEGNCDGSSDMVDDTPAEKEPASGCPIGQDSCPNQPGLDPIHNYDYTDDACYEEFTPGQIDRFQDQMATYRHVKFH
ncbi:metalloprotease [Flagelloscypha sp. PMI_526]|nr:metalloprotease [Flagelloscypha sp. PMI_526]